MMLTDHNSAPKAAVMLQTAPSMPSVPPSISRALSDSEFVYDGASKWDAERGIRLAHGSGAESEIAPTLARLEAALEPTPHRWFGQRLPVLWTQFMAARSADPRAMAIWLSETARLLSDLPHDIAAHAIDEAIKTSRHGFLPSVGEIRGVADKLLAERRDQIDRLRKMVAALADPEATASRIEQRRVEAVMAEDRERIRRNQEALGFEPARAK